MIYLLYTLSVNILIVELNFVKAFKAGFAAYAFNNAIIGILGGILGFIISKLPSPDMIGQVVTLAIAAAVVYYAALWYFSHQKAGWENGLILGAFFAVMSMAITLVQIVPQAIVQGQTDQIAPFLTGILSNIAFWISVGTTVLAGAAAGYMKNPKA
jgi:hypothetical protein